MEIESLHLVFRQRDQRDDADDAPPQIDRKAEAPRRSKSQPGNADDDGESEWQGRRLVLCEKQRKNTCQRHRGENKWVQQKRWKQADKVHDNEIHFADIVIRQR